MTREEIEDAYYKRIPIQFRWRSGGIEWKDCSPIYPSLNWERCEYRINPNADSTITIPKPKFQVGDVVSIPSGYSNGFMVYSRVYSPDKNMWFYSPNYEDNNSSMFLRLPELPAPKECFEESELKLVERKEDDTRNSIGL